MVSPKKKSIELQLYSGEEIGLTKGGRRLDTARSFYFRSFPGRDGTYNMGLNWVTIPQQQEVRRCYVLCSYYTHVDPALTYMCFYSMPQNKT